MENSVQLRLGEKIIPKAPQVKLSNGTICVPQHYLTYQHTLESVESLICSIHYDPRYLVFAAQENDSIYIQVGVIGHDNYKKHTHGDETKLLFGRKWRVEPELPTSEIIQSVFLAIKKSREHEVRELYKMAIKGSVTTPFNTHIDLPLMAEYYQLNRSETSIIENVTAEQAVNSYLNCIEYDHCKLKLISLEQRKNGLWLVDVAVLVDEKLSLPELKNTELNLQIDKLSLNTISRALMNTFIQLSDDHVDKNFSYKGFNRFDPSIDIADIAHLSQQTRKVELHESFIQELNKSNYYTDQMRIPPLKSGPLAEKYKKELERFQLLVT